MYRAQNKYPTYPTLQIQQVSACSRMLRGSQSVRFCMMAALEFATLKQAKVSKNTFCKHGYTVICQKFEYKSTKLNILQNSVTDSPNYAFSLITG